MNKIIQDPDYTQMLSAIKERIRNAQYQALKAVNKELIGLYWDIGQIIVTRQDSESWGKSVVQILAQDLQSAIPKIGGFSARNIWYMRNFYLCYAPNPKLQPLAAEIGWTHNVMILEKCKNELYREFYIRMTRKCGWTKHLPERRKMMQQWADYLEELRVGKT